MRHIPMRTVDSRDVQLPTQAVDGLAGSLRGRVVTPDAPDYDDIRTIWNAMVDRRPGMIVRCLGTADVLHAVRFARAHRLLISVRGGGHNIAGAALCDGGMVIDLSPMRSVHVDPAARTVTAAGGATLADLDRETQAFGLAVPMGINSTTGVAGLTLGAGFGWLSRKHGLSIDNLAAAEVVTADGQAVRASPTENSDLFWAIRGGSGNFGVVTYFTFHCHPLGPEIYAGVIVHRADQAGALLRRYREVAARMADDLTCWVILRKAPPLPFLRPEIHGREVVVLPVFFAGDASAGAQAIAEIRSLGTPVGEAVGPMPYVAWQSMFDPLLAPGARNYWKTNNLTVLDDGLLECLVTQLGKLPTPHCELFLGQLGGAVGRLPPDATAYPHRDANFVLNVHARWLDASEDAACITWAREVFEATSRYATGGSYVNFMTADEQRSHAAYGTNYDRLAALKSRFDPENMFRGNQTIPPPSP